MKKDKFSARWLEKEKRETIKNGRRSAGWFFGFANPGPVEPVKIQRPRKR